MKLLLTLTASLFLTSCADMASTVRNFSAPDLKKMVTGEKNIPIVQVRPEALREDIDSRQKALAYFENRRASRSAALAAVSRRSLKPLDLPAAGADFQGLPSAGILPPLNPGASSQMPDTLPPINFEGE